MAQYSIKQVRSNIGINKKVRENLKSLGLRTVGSTNVVEKTPSTDGLILKVAHLISYKIVE